MVQNLLVMLLVIKFCSLMYLCIIFASSVVNEKMYVLLLPIVMISYFRYLITENIFSND